MGTNYLWKVPDAPALPTGEVVGPDSDDPKVHIGKRSAAGPYCWDCRQTLCIGGESDIHFDSARHGWHEACPTCGKMMPPTSGLTTGPVAVELGFAKPNTVAPTGVAGCSSFSWAQDPDVVLSICDERPDEELVENEYGDVFTCAEFVQMLDAQCPVRYTTLIGTRFS